MASDTSTQAAIGGFRLLLSSIFLLSCGLLAFEIALTRLLSVLTSYHYVFAILSLALMGQGLGALYLALFIPRPATTGACMLVMSR